MNLVMSLAMARAPAGLADFRATRVAAEGHQLSYRIACRCGSEVGTIFSEVRVEDQFWGDPLVFQCAACGAATLFFDSRRDGYDAVLNPCDFERPPSTTERAVCSSCGSEHHRLLASYSYQFEDSEIEQWWSAEERAQMPDVFDWAAFELTCGECGATQWLDDFECA